MFPTEVRRYRLPMAETRLLAWAFGRRFTTSEKTSKRLLRIAAVLVLLEEAYRTLR